MPCLQPDMLRQKMPCVQPDTLRQKKPCSQTPTLWRNTLLRPKKRFALTNNKLWPTKKPCAFPPQLKETREWYVRHPESLRRRASWLKAMRTALWPPALRSKPFDGRKQRPEARWTGRQRQLKEARIHEQECVRHPESLRRRASWCLKATSTALWSLTLRRKPFEEERPKAQSLA